MQKSEKREKLSDVTLVHEIMIEASLLLRLQAQTLPDATPPVSKIHSVAKSP